MVRGQVLRLVSLPLWQALSSGRLQLELHAHPQVRRGRGGGKSGGGSPRFRGGEGGAGEGPVHPPRTCLCPPLAGQPP